MVVDRELTRLSEPVNHEQEELDQDEDGLNEPLLSDGPTDLNDGDDSHRAPIWHPETR